MSGNNQKISGFEITQWELIADAQSGKGALANEALSALCERYWFPLYAYARGRGYRRGDAEDLTQEFFRHFIEHSLIERVCPSRGRFRSFLLVSFRNFLADQWDKAKSIKRGRDFTLVSFDALQAEQRYAKEMVDELTPAKLYERSWALTVIQVVLEKLEKEYERAGKELRFRLLKCHLVGDDEESLTQIASSLSLTAGGVRTILHRMRKRYGVLFRQEISEIVANPAEVDLEIRHLLGVLS